MMYQHAPLFIYVYITGVLILSYACIVLEPANTLVITTELAL